MWVTKLLVLQRTRRTKVTEPTCSTGPPVGGGAEDGARRRLARGHRKAMDTSIVTTERRIVHRTRGNRHGPISRLMSPSDLGELVKPFVFLDLFDIDSAEMS